MKLSLKKIVGVPAVLGVMCSAAMATQVSWKLETTGANYSDGSTIPTGGITFAVGTFAPGFSPAGASFDDVVPNWNDVGLVAGSSAWTNLGNANFPSFGRLGTTGTAGTVVRPDGPIGSQGYIFGFTSLDVSVSPEWILLTNPGWTFPAGTPEGSVALVAAEWSALDAGTVALFGSSNIAGGAAALDRQIQTQAIPEPSTYALIFGLGILGFLGFRRARK